VRGGADGPEPPDRGERRRPVFEEGVLVGGDGGDAETEEKVDRRAEADDAGDVGGARLEALRRILVDGPLEGDVANHVPAALPRGERLPQRGLAVDRADPGGSEDLVA